MQGYNRRRDSEATLNEFQQQVAERTTHLETLNEELRARNRQQSAVAALGVTAISCRDPQTLIEEAAARVAETLGTEYSAVLELLPDAASLLMRAGAGWKEGLVGHHTVPVGDRTEAGFILRSDAPVVVTDLRQETRFDALPAFLEHGVISAIHVIIRGRSRPWGTLGACTTRERSFGSDDIGFLQSIANVLALAIERHEVEITRRGEEETLRTIFDNMPVMISVYDASGRLLRVNREWERVFGWTLEEAQRVDILAEAYPDPERRKEVVEFIQRAERQWFDFRPRARDGRVIDTSWARFGLSDGSVIGFGIDITERKKAEADRDRLLESESRARAEAEGTLEKLGAIQSITDRALHHLALDELLQELLARLRRALDADFATVLLLDEKREMLYLRAVDGYECLPSLKVRLGEGVSGRIAAEGRPLIIDALSMDDVSGIEGMPPPDSLATNQSVMGAPLQVDDEVIGVVVVSSRRPRRFTDEDLKLMLLVADRAAPAVERARLVETIHAGREQLEMLSRRLLAAQEEERRRLAIELHDELGQILTAVKINLESKRPSAAVPAYVKDAITSVDQAMDRVRDLALDLRPSVLDDLGLAAALRWYVDRFGRKALVETHLSIDAVTKLDPVIEITCFRLAQEALTNVVRHAQAKHVWFHLHILDDRLELNVRDDGIGFDAVAARARALGGASLGLLGMEERVSLVGGRFEVVSAPGNGTEVRAYLRVGETVRCAT